MFVVDAGAVVVAKSNVVVVTVCADEAIIGEM